MVLAFIVLYIPSFLETDANGAGNNQVVASVDGRDITAARFRRVYQQQMQAYRQSYGANVDERMLKQLGIDQRIVQQMIEEKRPWRRPRGSGFPRPTRKVRERIAVAGVPGERPLHRRGALSADAADAEPADAAR